MSQNYQVFVRSIDISLTNPVVMAMYPDTRPVDPTIHGQGMSVYTLPMEAIQQPSAATGLMPVLVDNWQSMVPVATMGALRTENTFPLSAQIESLHQTIEGILKYGTDLSRWPREVRQNKANFDELWKYFDEINERVKAYVASPTHDLSSDKAWPNPPSK